MKIQIRNVNKRQRRHQSPYCVQSTPCTRQNNPAGIFPPLYRIIISTNHRRDNPGHCLRMTYLVHDTRRHVAVSIKTWGSRPPCSTPRLTGRTHPGRGRTGATRRSSDSGALLVTLHCTASVIGADQCSSTPVRSGPVRCGSRTGVPAQVSLGWESAPPPVCHQMPSRELRVSLRRSRRPIPALQTGEGTCRQHSPGVECSLNVQQLISN